MLVEASVEKNGVAVVTFGCGGGSSTLSPGWVFKQNDITDMHIKKTETPAIILKGESEKKSSLILKETGDMVCLHSFLSVGNREN
jgi:hypothetical protein